MGHVDMRFEIIVLSSFGKGLPSTVQPECHARTPVRDDESVRLASSSLLISAPLRRKRQGDAMAR
jgi:hypothetical protein